MKKAFLTFALLCLAAPVFAQGLYNNLPTRTGDDTGTSFISVTAGNGSKGSWVQLIASTSRRSVTLILSIVPGASTPACDLGTGGAGSETVIIGNLKANGGGGIVALTIPFAIPASTRIAIRCQDAAGNTESVGLQVLEP